jgi:hypothetical protein
MTLKAMPRSYEDKYHALGRQLRGPIDTPKEIPA